MTEGSIVLCYNIINVSRTSINHSHSTVIALCAIDLALRSGVENSNNSQKNEAEGLKNLKTTSL